MHVGTSIETAQRLEDAFATRRGHVAPTILEREAIVWSLENPPTELAESAASC